MGLVVAWLAAGTVPAVGADPDIAATAHQREIEAWRQDRDERLRQPGGWLTQTVEYTRTTRTANRSRLGVPDPPASPLPQMSACPPSRWPVQSLGCRDAGPRMGCSLTRLASGWS